MKMPLAWHKQCLINSKIHMESIRKEYLQAQDRFNSAASRTLFLEIQITTAEEEGKDGFDSEKYMVGRKMKGSGS